MSKFHIIWTLLLMTIFIGIFIWAWSGRRKADFEEAARLPLDSDDPSRMNNNKQEADHA
ncbi:MAG: cbb3-type cytochrome c oxidase subunit 3 [Gammaproteobacteria bacterium]|jgi:cytochrome c oxidase cbb3-type subunit 4